MKKRTDYKAAYDAAKIAEDIQTEPDELEILEESEPVKAVSVLGKVVGCAHLNIRELPSKNGRVVATVPKDTILTLDMDQSTSQWYKAYTVAGVSGFCMKEFVTLN